MTPRMAVNFSDPACGFYHREVVDFLNEQISKHESDRFFNKMQLCESWGALERELQAVVTDSLMPRTIKKSCAWSALVLAVGLAEKQEQEHREKVKMMQDQLDEQKLLINALLGMIQKQRQKQQVVQGAAEFQIQQAPRDINRVEGEQNVVPGSPVSVVSTQYQNQEGTKEDKDQGTESTHPLDNAVLGGDGGDNCTETESPKVSGQDAVAAADPPVPLVEENRSSVRANKNEVDNSSLPEMQKALSQSCPLTSISLSSKSVQPGLVSQGVAAEAKETPIVPPVRYSWRGRRYNSRKVLPEKVKLRPGPSQYKSRGVVRRAGDWYCDDCNVMNFSWRNVCFRCKQFQKTKVIENYLYNWKVL